MEVKLLTKSELSDRLDQFLQLFHRSFGKSISSEYVTWRYIENPYDDLLMCVAINEDDKIIANYSASPCYIWLNNQKQKAAISMTTMTDPNYTGKGLFTKLANELYQHMGENNYAMIYGFPNHNSHYGFKNKLSWNDIYEIPTLTLNIQEINQTSLNDTNNIETDNSFDFDYSIINYLADFQIFRDAKYLKWRYYDHPVYNYENYVIRENQKVISYCVIKKYLNSVDIVDCYFGNSTHVKPLLSKVIEWAFNNKLTTINCWMPIHSENYAIFERIGFTNTTPITYFGAKLLDTNLTESKVSLYSNWFIQMGDSDVY